MFWGLFLKKILFISKERGLEGEKHQSVVAAPSPPTRDLAHNPGMRPDQELNWWPPGSQASTQHTEPHQPGLEVFYSENTRTHTYTYTKLVSCLLRRWNCAWNVDNEVDFFENISFNTIANKLHLQKINDFVLSPGPQSYKGVSMFQELRVDLYLLDFISAPTSMYLTQV